MSKVLKKRTKIVAGAKKDAPGFKPCTHCIKEGVKKPLLGVMVSHKGQKDETHYCHTHYRKGYKPLAPKKKPGSATLAPGVKKKRKIIKKSTKK